MARPSLAVLVQARPYPEPGEHDDQHGHDRAEVLRAGQVRGGPVDGRRELSLVDPERAPERVVKLGIRPVGLPRLGSDVQIDGRLVLAALLERADLAINGQVGTAGAERVGGGLQLAGKRDVVELVGQVALEGPSGV